MGFIHKILTVFISFLPAFLYFNSIFSHASIDHQVISLIPEKPLITKTLVTLGIPFAPGQLKNINHIRLYDENGKDVPIFTKSTLYWHWKKKPNNTIRSVKVQFYLDKGSKVKTYSFTFNSLRDLSSDLIEKPYDRGTQVSDNPNKAGMRSPIVIPIINTSWLEQSQIIPPFKGMNNDNQMHFWNKQFEWGRELDFTQKNIANWLFDRVSALYKGCMRAANADCYREAFLSYRFWNKHIKRTGRISSCKGGLNIDKKPKKACDNKYVYIEPIKIHVALTGDDGLHDEQLIKDMSELVYNNRWQGASYDLYNKENEVFTERHTGLSLLTLLNGYELVNDSTILSYVNKHIESLYQHQNSNPDKLVPDGSFRHSWARHENNKYPGDGDLDDRRFSPWMMENISDALWQAYFILEDKRIPEMLRFAGEALNTWGFANSKGYIDKFGASLHNLPQGASWKRSCNKEGELILYSASSTAKSKALVLTLNSKGWYSDGHNPEAIFTLAVAYYFEKNIVKSEALKKRITNIHDDFLRNCGQFSKTKRAFNWNNRSNYWGTYLWVLSQKHEKLPVADVSGFKGSSTSSYTVTKKTLGKDNSNLTGSSVKSSKIIKEILKEYQSTFLDDFNSKYQKEWVPNNQWFITNNTLQAKGYGLLMLGNSIDAGNDYRIELNITLDEKNISDKSILFGNEANTFYTARVVAGEYGGVYLYKHSSTWDMGGKVITSNRVSLFLKNNKLVVVVNGKNVKVYLNDTLLINFYNSTLFNGRNTGVFAQGGKTKVNNFLLNY